MLELASDSLLRDGVRRDRRLGGTRRRAAERLDDPVLTTAALAMQALAAAMRGAVPEAQELCDEAARAHRRPHRRGGRPQPRQPRAPRDRRDVHRPLRGLRAPRRTRAGGRSRDRPGRALPADLPDAGHGTVGAGQGRRGGPDLRRRGRGARGCGTTSRDSRGTSSTARSRPALAGDVELALATATESAELASAPGRQPRSRPTPRGRSPWRLLETGEAQEAADLLLASTGGAELRLDPRRLAGIRSRVADPLLPRGRPATRRPRRAVAAAAACAEAVGLPMAAAIAARASAATLARRRRSAGAVRAGARLGARLSRMPAASSTPPSRAHSPDARWRGGRARSRRGRAGTRRPRRSGASAAHATRPQPSTSCASSGGASTTTRDRERRTRSGWSRSASASSRWRG